VGPEQTELKETLVGRFSIAMMYTAVLLLSTILSAQPRSGNGRAKQPGSGLRAALDSGAAFAMTEADWDHDYRETKEEKIQKSFLVPAQRKSLDVDNVWGSIEVVADSTDKVGLTVERSTRAESKQEMEKADKEVTLDITQEEGTLKFYVNGPFRCHCDDCPNRYDEGYRVKMDFQIHVPREMDIKVRTVNEGHVTLRDINGNFLVRNVNGTIEMSNVTGSGTVHTVNGPVTVSFRQNPKENSDFKTVNGSVELRFTHDLSADFRVKTFNGGVYSDFPVTAMPAHALQQEHEGGKVVYRTDRYMEVRVNSGGPRVQVETLNGDIRILENHE
jgi:DUF4097 and DUF4098 domain-containing protein YvlB